MDFETKNLVKELMDQAKKKTNPSTLLHTALYSLEGKVADKLERLAGELHLKNHSLEIAKTEAESWKQMFLEQIKENVRLQSVIEGM